MISRLSKRLILVAGGLAVLVALAAPAHALTFSYSQQGGFTFGSQQQTAGSGGIEFFAATGFLADPSSPNAGQATYGEIGWGCGSAAAGAGHNNTCAVSGVAPTSPISGSLVVPGGTFPTDYRSGLDLDVFSGTVDVGGGFVAISSLQHYNRTIGSASSSLTQIDIDTLLTIALIPPVPPNATDPGFVQLGFKETNNLLSPCADPNPAGSNCDDIFTFQQIILAPLVITLNGKQYLVEFALDFPATTVDELCLALGGSVAACTVANGAVPDLANSRVFTAENEISEVIVLMRITALSVPLPATLILLGLGLAALAVVARVRRPA